MAPQRSLGTRLFAPGLVVIVAAVAVVATVRYATGEREGRRSTVDPGLQSLLVGRELWWVRSSLQSAGVRVETATVSSGRATLWARVVDLGVIRERAGRVVRVEIRPGIRPPLQLNEPAARSQCLTARPRLHPFYDQPVFGGPRVFLGGFLQADKVTYLSAGRRGGAFLQIVVPASSPSGPILVRGERVDGPGGIRFEQRSITGADGVPLVGTPRELHLPADRGLRVWSFILHFPAPGCYALQFDGRTFSQMIAFRAAPARPPRLPKGAH